LCRRFGHLTYRAKRVPFDLDSYAAQAEAFVSDLDREYHLHFSGQKPDYEVEAIYEGHRGLFDQPVVEALRERSTGPNAEDARRAAYLLELALGGYLGRATADLEAAMAELEASLELEIDDRRIGYRAAPVEQANEPDATRRAQIEAARDEQLELALNPLLREKLERSHELVRGLGWSSYGEAWGELRGVDFDALRVQLDAFLAKTEPFYESVLDQELREVLGLGLDEVARADLRRFLRAPQLDAGFPEERLLGSFAETMAALGTDLGSQKNVILDTERRPTKTPRAYCAPVRVPDEVYLVVPRVGGREDFGALFHEGGHAEHYAHVDPTLPIEYRYLGDNSVTESFAFLFEHLTENPSWLRRRLPAADAEAVVSHGRAVRLHFLRRYAAKLAYELELHGPDPDLGAMPERYVELLGAATGVRWTRATWLADVDDSFYVTAYLRAWALEARWRAALSERFGGDWFAVAAAGEWLRSLWRQGQRLRAHELLAEAVGESELEFESLAAELS
jgi:hypothetical protein